MSILSASSDNGRRFVPRLPQPDVVFRPDDAHFKVMLRPAEAAKAQKQSAV